MSFPNTKTHTKPTDESLVRYPVPRRPNAKQPSKSEYYLTPELEAKFRELYPVTMNPQLMEWFGLSHSTLHRFAQELGLTKDRAVILRKHAKQIKAICRKNGYYASIKGKQPSEQCLEAARRMRADGFHPMKRLKEINPRKYRATLRRKSKERKALIETERRRYQLDFVPVSNLPTHIYAGDQYSRYDVHVRSYAKLNGYICGSIDPDQGERHMIYYTERTARLPKFEQSATQRGWDFRSLDTRGKIIQTMPNLNAGFIID